MFTLVQLASFNLGSLRVKILRSLPMLLQCLDMLSGTRAQEIFVETMHKGKISKPLYPFYFDCLVLETRAFYTAFSSLELAVGFSFSEIRGTTPVFVS